MDEPKKIYRASGYWRTNVSGGVLGGIGGAVLLLTVFSIVVWGSGFATENVIWFIGICLALLATALAFYPGNLVATYPLAVEIEPTKQIVLIAPRKRLVIPIEEVRAVRDTPTWQVFQQGIVVKLNKRHGLLKSFIIHWAFGPEGKQLARAIREEISHRG